MRGRRSAPQNGSSRRASTSTRSTRASRPGARTAKRKPGSSRCRAAAGPGTALRQSHRDPGRLHARSPWQVRVQLHGGVNRPASATVGGAALEEEDAAQRGGRAERAGQRRENRIRGENQIYIHPNGFAGAEWWHAHQVENILRLVDRIKRRYNVDESRIYLTGISDGGTGVYYMAMKNPTLWSSFLPLNGSIKVLGNPSLRADGEMFAANLANRPFYIVSGEQRSSLSGRDVATHVEAFNAAWRLARVPPAADAGHDTSWWPYERRMFEQLRQAEAARGASAPSVVADRARRSVQSRRLARDRQAGHGDDGHRFRAARHLRPPSPVRTRGHRPRRQHVHGADAGHKRVHGAAVPRRRSTSPSPVAVRVNDKYVFDGLVKRDAAVLLKWAARDNDRTRLYGAEVKIIGDRERILTLRGDNAS